MDKRRRILIGLGSAALVDAFQHISCSVLVYVVSFVTP